MYLLTDKSKFFFKFLLFQYVTLANASTKAVRLQICFREIDFFTIFNLVWLSVTLVCGILANFTLTPLGHRSRPLSGFAFWIGDVIQYRSISNANC